MSVLVRRCALSRCIELIRKSNRSIVIRNGIGNANSSRSASTLCPKYAFAPLGRCVQANVGFNCSSIRFKSSKKDGKRNQSKDADEDSDEVLPNKCNSIDSTSNSICLYFLQDEDAELAQYSEAGRKDKNLIRIKVQSLRLDLLIKSVLRISRK